MSTVRAHFEYSVATCVALPAYNLHHSYPATSGLLHCSLTLCSATPGKLRVHHGTDHTTQ